MTVSGGEVSSREIGEANSRVVSRLALEPAGSPVRYPCGATDDPAVRNANKRVWKVHDRRWTSPLQQKTCYEKDVVSHTSTSNDLRSQWTTFTFFFSLPAAERLVVFSHQDISILRVPSKVLLKYGDVAQI